MTSKACIRFLVFKPEEVARLAAFAILAALGLVLLGCLYALFISGDAGTFPMPLIFARPAIVVVVKVSNPFGFRVPAGDAWMIR